MASVTVSWDWDPELHRRGRALVERAAHRRVRVLAPLVFLGAILAGALVSGLDLVSDTTMSVAYAVLVGVVVALVVVFVVSRRSEHRRLSTRSASGLGRTDTSFSESGIRFKNGEAEVVLGWSELKEVFFDEGFFIFVLHSAGGCYVPFEADDPRWSQIRDLIPGQCWTGKDSSRE